MSHEGAVFGPLQMLRQPISKKQTVDSIGLIIAFVLIMGDQYESSWGAEIRIRQKREQPVDEPGVDIALRGIVSIVTNILIQGKAKRLDSLLTLDKAAWYRLLVSRTSTAAEYCDSHRQQNR